VLTQ
jgi:predicted oxidoreductase